MLIATAIAVTGCASTLLPDSRLQANTAGVVGQPDMAVIIISRIDDGLSPPLLARTTAITAAAPIVADR